MPRFKPVETGYKLIPVCFESQIHPGSFEYAVSYLIDHECDLSEFIRCYNNDIEGASAFHPGVLLKIILVAYSRGVISSRKIEELCRKNVLFMAISGDSQPHFTTIANFISGIADAIAALFAQVLLICDHQGLIEPCMLRERCLRKPDETATRQVAFLFGKAGKERGYQEEMKHKIDSPEGNAMITARFATVEPVFENLRHNKKTGSIYIKR